ncbi:hypothetical protein B0J13DRAFT_93100 [Dactylonectria estremocensis]|uniref:Peptidase S8/S53 domain-containing protein n=1 Tax=Dactylonectria estremocensis TaxID=1079267 RepID=A0A9P9IUR0_9HYPO|nr:hypothetical protein B0J13DRAFT_93100 [Dactylonectria estremocensis]
MGRLLDEETGYLQLFRTVLPVFIEALPPRPSVSPLISRKQEELKNTISILRFEVQEMEQVLSGTWTACDLTNDATSEASNALEDALLCMEDLVRVDPEGESGSQTSFPKLANLSNHIPVQRANAVFNPSHAFPDELLGAISYGKEAAHYRRTIRVAQGFNRTVRRISDSLMIETESEMPQIFPIHHQVEEEQNKAAKEIHQAKMVCETTKSIVALLTEKEATCESPHLALIHLTGFLQPEIDMIMSLCVEKKKGLKKWHQVYWAKQIPSNAGVPVLPASESICSVLERSRKFKNLLRVYLQRDGSWRYTEAVARDRMTGYTKPPDHTLENLLSQGQNSTGWKLFKKDKLDLAVNISRSLFHLSGSPLLQGQWTTENILVAQVTGDKDSSGSGTRPYVSGQLVKMPILQEPQDSPHVNRLVLDLGVLLWQLLFGQKVTIEPEDEEDDDDLDPGFSLFNALNREHGNSQELFVEKPCLDIISNCLNLYALCQLDEQSFREKLYWDIVVPLKNYLEAFCQPQKSEGVKQRIHRSQLVPQSNKIPRQRFPYVGRWGQDSLRSGSISSDDYQCTGPPRSIHRLHSTFAESNLATPHGSIKGSLSWLDKFSTVNSRLERIDNPNVPPVRIAVLDTGCDINHEYFDGPGVCQDERLNGHWFDCVAGSDEIIDEDPGRHGTSVLALLLRLLPSADIFIARIAKHTDDLAIAQERIAEAIRHASQDWDVDIISLSFGFAESSPCIQEAISYAESLKGGRILFFAAANNQGRNQREMFPAWCESVISVRGTTHDGSFVPKYNPDSWSHKNGSELYGSISEHVPCGWTSDQLVKSGCSVATPIVAAIASMIIWFVSCKSQSFTNIENIHQLIRTRRGILSIFRVMTDDQDQEQRRRYLAPWQLFGDDDVNYDAKIHTIAHALSRLPPQGAI